MKILKAYHTDKGIKKEVNQDALMIKQARCSLGEVTLAVMCDGMGGLSKGELASSEVIRSFSAWFETKFPQMIQSGCDENTICNQWMTIVRDENLKMQNYGKRIGGQLGTTITAMMIIGSVYYTIHVGDSRLYEFSDRLYQLTQDQTVVAREISLGRLTREQALVDPRRNVLLQCIGASEEVTPDFMKGTIKKNAVYLLCTDGFRHEIAPEEMWEHFAPERMQSEERMQENAVKLTELNKARNETDNISIILLKFLDEVENG